MFFVGLHATFYLFDLCNRFPSLPNVHLNIGKMATRHAEIGAINALPEKARQLRYLKKTTLVVIRFIEPPPKQKYKDKRSKKRAKKSKRQKRSPSNSPISSNSAYISEDIDNCSVVSISSSTSISNNNVLLDDEDPILFSNLSDDENENTENETSNDFSLDLACSQPCSECLHILRALQLKSIIYVNEDGELVNQNPNHICNSVHSGGTLGIIQKR